ncbi:hypothetical protein E4M02_11805 [Brevundimonas sp. S30B]|uniref:tetratricopeptide repeat protein n=1 Tax=unclassified Brevundimonas TaxID=2622653 RepID=UPI001071C30B|nr:MULTISPECIES: hypothetical protein [unclassified Brevundimonas]QBX38791.1 hypothetical protein E4M01_14065 [Brevundimonas sp. MF30-B]TFW01383.1 hypothetical protein E4M02_11805 [Brevundimonas sp. S30B]
MIRQLNGHLPASLHEISAPLDVQSWDAARRDVLRWAAVAQRDGGDLQAAADTLKKLSNIWPDEPSFWLELLVIRARFDPNVDIDMSACPASVKNYPAVTLFLCAQAHQAGDADQARELLDRIGPLDPVSARAFADLHQTVVETLKLRPALEALSATNMDLGQARADALEALETLVLIADTSEALRPFCRSVGFFNIYGFDHPASILIEAMENVRDRLSVSGLGVYLGLLIALRLDDRAETMARDLVARPEAPLSFEMLRAIVLLAARRADAELENEALRRAERLSVDDPVRHAELHQRARSLGLDRPLRVFIGLFGQMRDPDQVIPALVEHLQQSLAPSGAEIRFGLATWPQTGFRPLSLDDSAGFFQQVVPPPLRPMLSDQHGADGHRLRAVWPEVVDALMDWSGSQTARTPDIETLEGLLPQGSRIALGNEDAVRQCVDQMPPATRSLAREQINQLKMWSRIADLGPLARAFEVEDARPFDCCILVRCDLVNLKGSPSALAARSASAHGRTIVFHDYDAHAEFIEGSGDRYMVASRSAAEVLFAGFDHYIESLQTDDQPLRERVPCHEGVQSLLFVSGLTPEPVWAMGYEIHRSAAPRQTLAAALRSEIEASRGTSRHDEATAALAALESVR